MSIFGPLRTVEKLVDKNMELKKRVEDLTAADLKDLDVISTYYERGIFTEEKTRLSPQEIMATARLIYNTFPRAQAGVSNLTNLIIAAGIRFKSVDPEDEQLDEWINDRRREIGQDSADPEIIDQMIWAGNSYVQYVMKDDKIERVMVMGLPHVMYADLTSEGKITQWVQRIKTKIGEQFKGARMYRIISPGGGYTELMGIPIPTKAIHHYKMGIGEFGVYGQGLLAAASDNIKTMQRLKRAIGVIAKTRAVDKTMIHAGTVGESGVWRPLAGRKYKRFKKTLQRSRDFEHILTNQDAKVTRLHGDDMNILPITNSLTEIERATLAPFAMEFAIFGNLTTYAVSHSQETILALQVERIRHDFIRHARHLYDRLLGEVGKERSKYEIIFEPYAAKLLKDPEERAMKLWRAGIKTRNECRAIIGDPPVEEDEMKLGIGDQFIDEVTKTQAQPEGMFSLPRFPGPEEEERY